MLLMESPVPTHMTRLHLGGGPELCGHLCIWPISVSSNMEKHSLMVLASTPQPYAILVYFTISPSVNAATFVKRSTNNNLTCSLALPISGADDVHAAPQVAGS